MKLRIFAGKLKFKTIHAPKTRLTRPVSSRLRQIIFSSIQNYIQNSHVLDLFAGSGMLAIEAISHGASKATLIEMGSCAYKTIQKNITDLGLNKQTRLIKTCGLRYLSKTQESFNIIFLDPPYTFQVFEYETLLRTIQEKNILKKNGIIILELDYRQYNKIDPSAFKAYSLIKSKKLGDTTINILTLN